MIVPGHGPLDSPIIVIGEAPGREEEDEGRPFVGPSGRLLRGKFLLYNVNPDLIRYENLMEIRPPDNDFDWFTSTDINKALLAEKVTMLKKRIRELKPNIVLLVGAKPLFYMTGYTDVGSWRGHVMWSEELNCKVICTYHPSSVLRQRFVDKSQKPGQYEALFDSDINKCIRHSTNREYSPPKYSLLLQPTYQEAIAELKHLKETAKVLSFDIETAGHAMTCIAFAATQDRACSIPFLIVEDDKVSNYWKDPQEEAEVLRCVIDLLESDIPKVAQNSQYDMAILLAIYKIQVKNLVWDTLCAAHNLYCDLPKDLGSLIAFYTDWPYHKHKQSSKTLLGFWEYNALDALTTLVIMEAQILEMQEHGILEHYRKITNPLITCLVKMQVVGVKVDIKRRDHARMLQEDKIQDFANAFNAAFPDLKPKDSLCFASSSQKCAHLFYNILECRKVHNRGKLTCNEEALETIGKRDPRPFVRELTKAVLIYRKSCHMAAVLRVPLTPDGRMQTAYDASGTDSGRLASKKSIFGTGTNLQNLEVGIQRQQLIPG